MSSILFVDFLDHPYENTPGSLKPVDMTKTLALMNADQKASGRSIDMPCDARGKETVSR